MNSTQKNCWFHNILVFVNRKLKPLYWLFHFKVMVFNNKYIRLVPISRESIQFLIKGNPKHAWPTWNTCVSSRPWWKKNIYIERDEVVFITVLPLTRGKHVEISGLTGFISVSPNCLQLQSSHQKPSDRFSMDFLLSNNLHK